MIAKWAYTKMHLCRSSMTYATSTGSGPTERTAKVNIARTVQRQNSQPAFYAVKSDNPQVSSAIFESWSTCKSYTDGVRSLDFRKFKDLTSAKKFISGSNTAAAPFHGFRYIQAFKEEEFNQLFKLLEPKEVLDHQVLQIYCDGSSLSNGKEGARAGYGIYFAFTGAENVSERLTYGPQTNNRAELKAVSVALDYVWQRLIQTHGKNEIPEIFEIYTDSEYVSKLLNGRFEQASRSELGRVKHGDIIKPMVEKFCLIRHYYLLNKEFSKGYKFGIQWCRGHDGNKPNEEADKLAREGAKKDVACLAPNVESSLN